MFNKLERLDSWLKKHNNTKVYNYQSSAQLYSESEKRRCDLKVEAKLKADKETDPVKKMKMQCRIANGIYDFSDL